MGTHGHLIVDRTDSFVLALAIGGIVMAVGAAVYYFMVGARLKKP